MATTLAGASVRAFFSCHGLMDVEWCVPRRAGSADSGCSALAGIVKSVRTVWPCFLTLSFVELRPALEY